MTGYAPHQSPCLRDRREVYIACGGACGPIRYFNFLNLYSLMSFTGRNINENLSFSAQKELTKCYTKYNVDSSVWPIYTLSTLLTSELEMLKSSMHKALEKSLGIGEVVTFLRVVEKPSPEEFVGWSMDEVFQFHITEFDKGWSPCGGNNEGNLEWYPFGCVVVPDKDWMKDGVVVFHAECEDLATEEEFQAERQRAKEALMDARARGERIVERRNNQDDPDEDTIKRYRWRVHAARFMVDNVGAVLTSLQQGDQEMEELIEGFGVRRIDRDGDLEDDKSA